MTNRTRTLGLKAPQNKAQGISRRLVRKIMGAVKGHEKTRDVVCWRPFRRRFRWDRFPGLNPRALLPSSPSAWRGFGIFGKFRYAGKWEAVWTVQASFGAI